MTCTTRTTIINPTIQDKNSFGSSSLSKKCIDLKKFAIPVLNTAINKANIINAIKMRNKIAIGLSGNSKNCESILRSSILYPVKYIIFSLGNPGSEYRYTRHNAARIAFDNLDWKKINTETGAEYNVPDKFMNESGVFVKNFLKYKEGAVPVVTYDDKDIELGDVKISFDKSAGGHNGVQNVIEQLGTTEFIRIRIGIGAKPHPEMLLQDYVLSKLNENEIDTLKKMKTKLEEMLFVITKDGYQKAMEKYN